MTPQDLADPEKVAAIKAEQSKAFAVSEADTARGAIAAARRRAEGRAPAKEGEDGGVPVEGGQAMDVGVGGEDEEDEEAAAAAAAAAEGPMEGQAGSSGTTASTASPGDSDSRIASPSGPGSGGGRLGGGAISVDAGTFMRSRPAPLLSDKQSIEQHRVAQAAMGFGVNDYDRQANKGPVAADALANLGSSTGAGAGAGAGDHLGSVSSSPSNASALRRKKAVAGTSSVLALLGRKAANDNTISVSDTSAAVAAAAAASKEKDQMVWTEEGPALRGDASTDGQGAGCPAAALGLGASVASSYAALESPLDASSSSSSSSGGVQVQGKGLYATLLNSQGGTRFLVAKMGSTKPIVCCGALEDRRFQGLLPEKIELSGRTRIAELDRFLKEVSQRGKKLIGVFRFTVGNCTPGSAMQRFEEEFVTDVRSGLADVDKSRTAQVFVLPCLTFLLFWLFSYMYIFIMCTLRPSPSQF